MATWHEFTTAAPRVAGMFARRHAAAGNLCLLATLRADGYPRISPMEPRTFERQLWLVGMPGTTKFLDLARDPRLSLHTATIDTQVTEGDAKLWGTAHHVADRALQQRFAAGLFDDTGFDLRGSEFEHFYAVDIEGGSSVEIVAGRMEVTIWREGRPSRVVIKE